ncbi:MAG: hypothetical protein JWN42_247, partial [Candidatus Angelobacter sp.]|nr:hypothetical protein [Candidatus Angelobacter sp.]
MYFAISRATLDADVITCCTCVNFRIG